MYRISLHCIVVLSVLSLQRPQPAAAQGTLDDYKRAQQFLPGNLRHSIYVADVPAHWIAKTNTFWYRKVGREGSEFVRVDASHNTVAPRSIMRKLQRPFPEAPNANILPSTCPSTRSNSQ